MTLVALHFLCSVFFLCLSLCIIVITYIITLARHCISAFHRTPESYQNSTKIMSIKAGTHYPYIRPVCTGRIYGHIFCTRIYGPYVRPVYTGGVYRAPVYTGRRAVPAANENFRCILCGDVIDVIYNVIAIFNHVFNVCLLYTSPSPRDRQKSRMPSSA